jgi:hypothetical protein
MLKVVKVGFPNPGVVVADAKGHDGNDGGHEHHPESDLSIHKPIRLHSHFMHLLITKILVYFWALSILFNIDFVGYYSQQEAKVSSQCCENVPPLPVLKQSVQSLVGFRYLIVPSPIEISWL